MRYVNFAQGARPKAPPICAGGARPPAREPCFAAHVARLLALSPWSEARGTSRLATGTSVFLRAALATGPGPSSAARGARG